MKVNPKLVKEMKAFSRQGAKFGQAKVALMDAGWTETEVMDASEQFPYVTLAEAGNVPADGMTPVLRQEFGDAMIEAQVEVDKDQFNEDARQAAFGVGHTSTYEHKDWFVTWDLDVPWWVYYPGCVAIIVIAVWLQLSSWQFVVIVGGLIVIRVWQRYPRYKDPKGRR